MFEGEPQVVQSYRFRFSGNFYLWFIYFSLTLLSSKKTLKYFILTAGDKGKLIRQIFADGMDVMLIFCKVMISAEQEEINQSIEL